MERYFASEEGCFKSEADCHWVPSQQQETRSFPADHNGFGKGRPVAHARFQTQSGHAKSKRRLSIFI